MVDMQQVLLKQFCLRVDYQLLYFQSLVVCHYGVRLYRVGLQRDLRATDR